MKYKGLRFGSRVVTKVVNSQLVEYRCDCGGHGTSSIGNMRKTVGCAKCRASRIARHGMAKTPEYGVWVAMNQRCHNENCDVYWRYGGRGIRVCPQWRGRGGFGRFIADVGQRPSLQHSLERKKNSRGYTPKNVCWATTSVQSENRRNVRLLTLNGRTMSVSAWARELRMSPCTITGRLRKGWPVARVLDSATVRDTAAHQRLVDTVKKAERGVVVPNQRWMKRANGYTKLGRRTTLGEAKLVTLRIDTPRLKQLDELCAKFGAFRTDVVDAAIELLYRNAFGERRRAA